MLLITFETNSLETNSLKTKFSMAYVTLETEISMAYMTLENNVSSLGRIGDPRKIQK